MMPDSPPDPFARDAFISYANQDKSTADAVCADLESRGIRCWIAPRNVMPGALYADAIVRAINGAKILILVLSQFSVDSSHVGKEIERASSKRRPILTLRVDAAPLTPSLEYFLSESQWVDAHAVGLEAMLPKVALAVQALLVNPEAASKGMPAGLGGVAHSGSAQSASTSKGARFAIGGAVLLALIAGTLAARHWMSPPAPSQALNAGEVAKATADVKSVAVLPFEDLSEKKDQAYFSDGLSSELIDLLAKIPGLRVPARVSSFYFKGKQASLEDIAHALNVTHLLEGTVRSSGQTLRITTDLVDVATGTPVWSQSYDRKLDDIFKIQDEIAESVVNALKVSLMTPLRATPTANTAAYTAYLKCQESFILFSNREGVETAIRECEQAVALDPNFAPGWLGLANALRDQFVMFGQNDLKARRARIGDAIERARTLDPDSAGPHESLALVLYQLDFNPAAAELEVQKAVAIEPNVPFLNFLTGYIASIQCRYADALAAFENALARNPLASDVGLQIGNVHYRAGDLAAAMQAYQGVLAIQPNSASIHYRMGLVALLQGDPSAALAHMQQEYDPVFRAAGIPMAYDALGRKAEADRAIATAESVGGDGAAYQVALIYAARHDADKTFAWLDRAYEQRDAGMLWIKGEPFLKELRGDPRFKRLLQQMHLN